MKKCTVRKAKLKELVDLVEIDNEASKLYEKVGLRVDLGVDHPFVVAESIRWTEAIRQGCVFLALDFANRPIGFTACCLIDNEPYLDQLSVHPNNMRAGVGAALLERVIRWGADRPLWLTTYAHVPWNKPYYEKHGFVQVSEEFCGFELRQILQKQRSALPDPNERIAMVRLNLSVSD